MRAEIGIDERGWYLEIRAASPTEWSMIEHVKADLGLETDRSSGAAWVRQIDALLSRAMSNTALKAPRRR